MGVPNSGPLGLRGQIGKEFYGNETGSDISIHAMAVAKGFAAPDAFSEWYGYTNNVTVTLDGGQAKVGPPGSAGFGSLTFNVTAPSGRGYTSTDVSNATLTGLPAAFVASFASTGTSTGRWSITTPDGLYPDASYALLTSSLSYSNPSTPLYTLNVTFSGFEPFFNGNRSATVFQGSTAGVGIGTTTAAGYVWNDNANGSGNGLSVVGSGAGNITKYLSAYRVMNGNFTGNVSYYAQSSCNLATMPQGYVNAPPWSSGQSQGMQSWMTQWYPSNAGVDTRVQGSWQLQSSNGCTSQGTIWIPTTPNGQNANRYYQGPAGPAPGTYTATLCNNVQGCMWEVAGYPFV